MLLLHGTQWSLGHQRICTQLMSSELDISNNHRTTDNDNTFHLELHIF